VTRAAVNGVIGERMFDFPKKSQVQLPDLKALFKQIDDNQKAIDKIKDCLLYTSPSPRDLSTSRMPSSA